MIDQTLKIEIKTALKKSIRKFFKNKKVTTFHVLDYIFPVERRIRSLIGGLETSLGTTVWEPVAKTLAQSNGFTIVDRPLLMPDPFPKLLQDEISELKRLRECKTEQLSMEACVNRLKELINSIDKSGLSYINPPSGKGVDIYLIKDDKEYVFDIKTNQPNKRAGLDLNLQLLEWYAYRLCQAPLVEIEARIAFPFNPYANKSWWYANAAKVYPLEEHKDAWVQDEFWDFCSGKTNTWNDIRQIFIELGQENFGQEFTKFFNQ
ncbi:MAG TPA: TdeIII family type II restriction endonuclease [Cyanothece sp. UBA12306]|nr:TdeIII family type II restriction endonuclease [Cyanothece sp. UBA12306]